MLLISLTLAERMRSLMLPRQPPRMRTWAEDVIVIPDGPRRGERFDCTTQPFAGLFFDAVDSGLFDRIVATGPTQTGKSLICYVVPVLYHCFAIGETVVAGLPTLDMADDKWREDFLPAIESSPALRELLPTTGQGSRAGRVRTRVKFRNGSTLRFLTAGGNDKTRAGFTARVLAVTEVDGLDEAGAKSREADKLRQMEGRQRAYLAAGIRTYLECTVSTSSGRIWTEYQGGTESRIARPCPVCCEFVTPDREHLVGWQGAADELQARAAATWSCPACSAPWTEAERYAANLRSVLVHRGQTVSPCGEVIGPMPPTRTLGFRWTAVDNHFATAADVAADEWNGAREADRENAEKELRQFVHCLPYDPPDVALTPLDPLQVRRRVAAFKKGIVPPGCVGITVGIDTGKRMLHWVAIAWLPGGAGHVIDYGQQTVDADRLGVRAGLTAALRTLTAYLSHGWQDSEGKTHKPSQVWIDSGWSEHQDGVYDFCGEGNKGLALGAELYRPTKGHGTGQRRMDRYWVPKDLTEDVRYIGAGYDLRRSGRGRMIVAHVNADHWKSELHQRLSMPPDASAAIVLFEVADELEHAEFTEQLTAEEQREKFVEGIGEAIVWHRVRRANHYLDAAYSACAAGDLVLSLLAP